MSKEPIAENKMGYMPVGKLVFNISLPIMISMLVQAMYNVVDSIFVAMLSENALTAVSLAFPLQTLLIAVGAGTGVGMNALLSKSLGEKDPRKATSVARNVAFLYVLSALLFLVLGMTIVKPFFQSQIGSADPQIMEYGVTYLTIVLSCSFGIFGQFYFERLLTSTGKTTYTMLSQMTGAITNIILDPILIFGLLGLPKMGVAGAALATVIGQIFGALMGCYFHFKHNHEVKLDFRGFRPNGKLIWNVYQIAIPSIIMQSIGSIMTYSMNLILIGFSATATAVFGVYFKLQSFFFMPVFGLNNGLTPIIAYSYGARQRKRMIKAMKISYATAFCMLFAGFAAFLLIPEFLLSFFDASQEMISIGVPALRIIASHFLIAWFCIISGTIFQALGYSVFSLITSVMRQLVVLIPAAFILSRLGGLSAVWWAFPIAEIMSFTVNMFFLLRVYRKVIQPLPDGNE